MNSLLFLIVSSLCIIENAVHCSEEVPVLAWGSGSEFFNLRVPAQRKLSTSEFLQDFVGKIKLDEPTAIVTFVEKTLSPEDFVSSSTDDEESAYPTLQKTFESGSSTKYLPYVSNPLKAFQALNYETHELPSSQSSHILPDSAKHLFVVKLDDAREEEERLNLLQRHDKFIHHLCSTIQEKYDKVVCVLTAERKSWMEPGSDESYSNRKLLQTVDSTDLNLYYDKNIGMIYTKQPPILFLKNTNETVNLSVSPTNPPVTGSNNVLTATLASSKGNFRLSFKNLSNMSMIWELNEVEVSINGKVDTLRTKSYIGASLGNSFHTPSRVTFDGSNYSLTFEGLQAQYFESPSSAAFGPAEDSVYFFTIPILSGLFVTSLLITIVLIGLTMIFDIKTMDLFDDPKGKTITINASD